MRYKGVGVVFFLCGWPLDRGEASARSVADPRVNEKSQASKAGRLPLSQNSELGKLKIEDRFLPFSTAGRCAHPCFLGRPNLQRLYKSFGERALFELLELAS